MSKKRSVSEVKAKLSECIRDAEYGEPVVITRHGRPVAALVGAEDFEQFERLRSAGPVGGLVSLAGGWEDADELVRALEETPRGGSRPVRALD